MFGSRYLVVILVFELALVAVFVREVNLLCCPDCHQSSGHCTALNDLESNDAAITKQSIEYDKIELKYQGMKCATVTWIVCWLELDVNVTCSKYGPGSDPVSGVLNFSEVYSTSGCDSSRWSNLTLFKDESWPAIFTVYIELEVVLDGCKRTIDPVKLQFSNSPILTPSASSPLIKSTTYTTVSYPPNPTSSSSLNMNISGIPLTSTSVAAAGGFAFGIALCIIVAVLFCIVFFLRRKKNLKGPDDGSTGIEQPPLQTNGPPAMNDFRYHSDGQQNLKRSQSFRLQSCMPTLDQQRTWSQSQRTLQYGIQAKPASDSEGEDN